LKSTELRQFNGGIGDDSQFENLQGLHALSKTHLELEKTDMWLSITEHATFNTQYHKPEDRINTAEEAIINPDSDHVVKQAPWLLQSGQAAGFARARRSIYIYTQQDCH